jgi:hypothetical protein
MGKSSRCRIVAGEQQVSEYGSHCRFKAFRRLLGKQYELAHGMWFTIIFPLGMSVLLISSRQLTMKNMKINHNKKHTCKHSFSIESLSSIYGPRWCALECNSFWEDYKNWIIFQLQLVWLFALIVGQLGWINLRLVFHFLVVVVQERECYSCNNLQSWEHRCVPGTDSVMLKWRSCWCDYH